MLAKAVDTWEKQLQVITVDMTDINKKIVFYTSVYHACLSPNIFNDVDESTQ